MKTTLELTRRATAMPMALVAGWLITACGSEVHHDGDPSAIANGEQIGWGGAAPGGGDPVGSDAGGAKASTGDTDRDHASGAPIDASECDAHQECQSCVSCAQQGPCAAFWEACEDDKHCPVFATCFDECLDSCSTADDAEGCLEGCVMSEEGCAGLHLAPAVFDAYLSCAGCQVCGAACGGVLCS